MPADQIRGYENRGSGASAGFPDLYNANSHEPLIVCSMRGDMEIVYANRKALLLLGYKSVNELKELTSGTLAGILAPKTALVTIEALKRRAHRENDIFRDVELTLTTRTGEHISAYGFGRTARYAGAESLLHLSIAIPKDPEQTQSAGSIDSLTGLITKRPFLDVLAGGAFGNDPSRTWAVAYINLVGFMFYNMRLGFQEADAVLLDVAKVLTTQLPGALVSRFGEDNFVVLAGYEDLYGKTSKLYEEIDRVLSDDIDCKIGIRLIDDEQSDPPDVICSQAKLACELIEADENRHVMVYSNDIESLLSKKRGIGAQLDEAIRLGHIQVLYQPIVDAQSGIPCAMEALARWNDPTFGIIPPSLFIPTLEGSQTVHRLDAFIIESICKKLRERLDENAPVLPVSFNLSRSDFSSSYLFETVIRLTEQYAIPHHLLRPEITESTILVNEAEAARQMSQFQEAGFSVWLDDFGSGYASLHILKDHTFDGVKLDASLLGMLGQRGKAILRSLSELSRELGCYTVIEGSETIEQVQFLRQTSCDAIQGFYFGEPGSFESCFATTCSLDGKQPFTTEKKQVTRTENSSSPAQSQPHDAGEKDSAAKSSESAAAESGTGDFSLADSLDQLLAHALGEPDSDTGIKEFIEGIGKGIGADRSYIIEHSDDEAASITYEWDAASNESRQSLLEKDGFACIDFLDGLSVQGGLRMIADISQADILDDRVFSHLNASSTLSLISAPLELDGKPLGLFLCENPDPSIFKSIISQITIAARFIAIMLRNRDIVSRLGDLSMRDDLTGILNRRGLESYVRSLKRGTRIEVIFGDINNLKEVNDTLGHEAGDALIVQTGKAMVEIAGRGHVFRLGGDEFVMTFELEEGEDGLEQLERAQDKFEKEQISIALGHSVVVAPINNPDPLLSEADRNMYKNKLEMHQSQDDQP
ncbi:MAG: EAL domain-containing protein [Coriobacteriales bacterium]|jgi:diguanylate cyclase (GGDEF)-like protein